MLNLSDRTYPELGFLINGRWVRRGGRRTQSVLNPATGELLGELPLATAEDIDEAADAAERGFTQWRAVPAFQRAAILQQVAARMREHAEALGLIITLEQGKRLPEAVLEVRAAADTFEWMAEEGKRVYGRIVPPRTPGTDQFVRLEPVGAVAAFSPWNFPAALSARKVATALAAGCSVVLKPAEETPGIMIAIAQLCVDAGVPSGVINILYGVPAEVSSRLIASRSIRKVSFTGSVPVGRMLATQAGAELKKITLELGGHAPVVVMGDVDVNRVVDLSLAAKFRNAGQLCLCPTRFFVHESVHKAFASRFAERANAMVVGNGQDSSVDMGPLINQRRVDAMQGFCADALDRGARIIAGGAPPDRMANGHFWRPTVIDDIPDDARAMREEPFGPLALITPFSELDAALKRANSTDFGLASYAFTNSLSDARAIEHGLHVGNVSINTFAVSPPELPFSGVKHSGLGSEMGAEGLADHFELKSVIRALPPSPCS